MNIGSKIVRNGMCATVIAFALLFITAEAKAQTTGRTVNTTQYNNPYLGITQQRTVVSPTYQTIDVPVYQQPQVVYIQATPPPPVKKVVYQDVNTCKSRTNSCSSCDHTSGDASAEFIAGYVYKLDPKTDSIVVDQWRSAVDFKYVLTADKSKLTYYERVKNKWKKVTENEVRKWHEDDECYILDMDSGQTIYYWKDGKGVIVEGSYETIAMFAFPL